MHPQKEVGTAQCKVESKLPILNDPAWIDCPEDQESDDLVCFASAVANKSGSAKTKDTAQDPDSFIMAIDNACSYCITNDSSHFIGKPESVKMRVRGVGGQVTATLRGTVSWSFVNDSGAVHEELIPGTYYDRQAPYCLYSPQHVAQIANDHTPEADGTGCFTGASSVALYWKQKCEN